ncbi:hypothetical protein BKA62DRAFT_400328 [Auriculariales sp. MPI-PUGE-AT-0066]|nr:hypothetical protein BKA62DRAFT_400328 [Auriculariales sp. MPI-PUGE-AT-0066]
MFRFFQASQASAAKKDKKSKKDKNATSYSGWGQEAATPAPVTGGWSTTTGVAPGWTDWAAPAAGGNDWSAPTAASGWTHAPQPTGKTPRSTARTVSGGWAAAQDTTATRAAWTPAPAHKRTNSMTDWEDFGAWPATASTMHKKVKDKTKSRKKEQTIPELGFFGSYPAYHRTPQPEAARTPSFAYQSWGAPTPGPSKTPKMPSAATPAMSMGTLDPFHGAFAVAGSDGLGLEEGERALFGRHRPSVGRIIWGMPPQKDLRVHDCMLFIQDPQVRNELTTIAVRQFIMMREPGAFFMNAGETEARLLG